MDLVANIEDRWANKSVPVALMVDLEKAFDSVRIHGLLLKMLISKLMVTFGPNDLESNQKFPRRA